MNEPETASTKALAELEAAAMAVERVLVERKAQLRPRPFGVTVFRNVLGAPMFSLGIHFDWHTPTLDIHLPEFTIQGRAEQLGRSPVRVSRPGPERAATVPHR